MGKPSVMREMPKAHRYLMQDIFLAYLAMGIYLTLIGSALPSIKAEYHISYQVGGWMMSAQQIGYLAMGIGVSLAARRFGAKFTYLFFGALAFVGLAIMMVSGNPVLLIFAMLLTGICKGSTANIGNQITSMVSNNDSSLLNLAQAFFAVGACAAPLIMMVCGTSWRMAFGITIAIGIISLLHGVRTQIGPDAFCVQEPTGKTDWGFLKQGIFWICSVLLLCYLAFEASVIGWLVTFFIDSGAADAQTAQLLATALGRAAHRAVRQRMVRHTLFAAAHDLRHDNRNRRLLFRHDVQPLAGSDGDWHVRHRSVHGGHVRHNAGRQ